jgi:hypothetical protein
VATRCTIGPVLFVPERKSLVPPESREAAHSLVADIRSAETARELLLHARSFHSDAAEFRNLLNLVESEIITKIEQFARDVEIVSEAPRIVPPKDAEG